MPALKVNGRSHDVTAPEDAPLLFVLRNDLDLNGPKFGCGLSQCGACTVLVDGQPVRSCVTATGAVAGAEITTLEGLGTIDRPHRLQKAFMDEQAMQCGYCVNGVIMRAEALLRVNPKPTEAEVRAALDGNLCRCGAHNRMVRAVLRAAREA
jgi:nicotinate dehydrogenase subunit A